MPPNERRKTKLSKNDRKQRELRTFFIQTRMLDILKALEKDGIFSQKFTDAAQQTIDAMEKIDEEVK